MKILIQWISMTVILASVICAAAEGPGSGGADDQSVSGATLRTATTKGQVGRSLLGLLEEQIDKRMGSSGKPSPGDRPAVRAVAYDKLGVVDIKMIFGYDANNRCCYVKAGGWGTQRELFKPAMDFVLGEAVANDTVDSPRAFPQLLSQDSRRRWRRDPGGASDKAQVGIERMVMATSDKKAYAMFDLAYDSDLANNPTVHSAMKMMDAELFWDTALHNLLLQSKQGMPTSGSKHVRNMQYEEAVTSVVGSEHSDQMYMVARRLTSAVTAVVKNPDLPLDLVQEAVANLWRMDGSDLTKDLLPLVRGGQAQSLRAAEVLGQYRDPEAIEDILTLWAKSPKTPQYLVALKQISGKDLGDDVAAWRSWWNDSKAPVMKDYDDAQKVLFDDVDVFVNQGSKTYHRHWCSQLKGQAACVKLHEARKDCTPCSECNPAK